VSPHSLKKLGVGVVAVTCLLAATAASAKDKPSWRDGRQVFKKCEACHSFKPDEHRFGPSLYKVTGRKAAGAPGFPYSAAMKQRGTEGLAWTDKAMDAFFTAPRKFVPKTKMAFPGLKDAKDRRNVIAYVKRMAKRGR